MPDCDPPAWLNYDLWMGRLRGAPYNPMRVPRAASRLAMVVGLLGRMVTNWVPTTWTSRNGPWTPTTQVPSMSADRASTIPRTGSPCLSLSNCNTSTPTA